MYVLCDKGRVPGLPFCLIPFLSLTFSSFLFLSLFLSFSLSLFLSFSLSLFLSFTRSLFLSFSLSLFHSLSPSLCHFLPVPRQASRRFSRRSRSFLARFRRTGRAAIEGELDTWSYNTWAAKSSDMFQRILTCQGYSPKDCHFPSGC